MPLVKASSGDRVVESPRELRMRFYLVVLHGRFVCHLCPLPPGAKPPRGTIATIVWSPREGVADSGVSDRLAAGMARLGRPITISLNAASAGSAVETPSALAMWTPSSGLVGMTSYHPESGSIWTLAAGRLRKVLQLKMPVNSLQTMGVARLPKDANHQIREA